MLYIYNPKPNTNVDNEIRFVKLNEISFMSFSFSLYFLLIFHFAFKKLIRYYNYKGSVANIFSEYFAEKKSN